jgi:DNA repair exonuclease SbcCD ATPase subunit
MTPITAPPIAAITDALTLIRFVQNPKEASELIEKLNDATVAHEKVYRAIVGREDSLKVSEAKLKEFETELHRKEQELNDRLATVAASMSAVDTKSVELTKLSADLKTKEAALTKQELTQLNAATAREARLQSMETALNERETSLVAEKASLDDRMSKLRALAV